MVRSIRINLSAGGLSLWYAIGIIFWQFPLVAIPLFDQYSSLKSQIPYIPLAQLPTPVHACHGLASVTGHTSLFIKRDDLTGTCMLYGGNKVRKLEFLLADALAHNATRVITYGAAGTNHGLATACYCHTLGLSCLLMIRHQVNSPIVRQNLLLDHYFKSEIAVFTSNADRNAAKEQMLLTDPDCYFIPVGGSVPLGAIGFVNAAFELQQQIAAGLLPKPDYIYLPIGSCGTTAGLLLGLALAKIDAKIIAVAVEPEYAPDAFLEKTKQLFLQTNLLLHTGDASIPLCDFPESQLCINKYFCTVRYGVSTPESDNARALMDQHEGITLEGTYSAKAVAVLLDDIKHQIIQPTDVVLFWNTYCGIDYSHLIASIDYKELPSELHTYFE